MPHKSALSLFLHAMHAADISVNYGSKLGFQMGFLSPLFPFSSKFTKTIFLLLFANSHKLLGVD